MKCRLEWCGYDAAKYAVSMWHYSRTMPKGNPLNKIGVWESDRFIGAIIYGRGASGALFKPFGLKITEGAELVRIALRDHAWPVSRLIAISLAMLHKRNPGLRLIISFADPMQEHLGIVYQASNWVYTGVTAPSSMFIDKNGKRWHPRNVSSSGVQSNYGRLSRCPLPSECEKVVTLPKHRYVWVLSKNDRELRDMVEVRRMPYPKRAGSIVVDAPVLPDGRGRINTDPGALIGQPEYAP